MCYATFGTVCTSNLHLCKGTLKSNAIHAKNSEPVSGRGFWTDEQDNWAGGWPEAEGENKSRLYRRLITTSTKKRDTLGSWLELPLLLVGRILILTSF
jgi:hypothetical protein